MVVGLVIISDTHPRKELAPQLREMDGAIRTCDLRDDRQVGGVVV